MGTLIDCPGPLTAYHGSAFTMMNNFIYQFVHPHEVWIDLCFGAGGATGPKAPSTLEIANEIDPRVFNFFTIVRTRKDELIDQLINTPYHEMEYRLSKDVSSDPLEDARRFYNLCQMSFGGAGGGFKTRKMAGNRNHVRAYSEDAVRGRLDWWRDRLKGIMFFNRDCREIIQKHADVENGIMFFDPPFVEVTRVAKNKYNYEFTDKDHEECAELLNGVSCSVIVCGYSSELYDKIYNGWERHDLPHKTRSGKIKIYSVWINDKCKQSLVEKYPLLNLRKNK